jgi:hypothetical protein
MTAILLRHSAKTVTSSISPIAIRFEKRFEARSDNLGFSNTFGTVIAIVLLLMFTLLMVLYCMVNEGVNKHPDSLVSSPAYSPPGSILARNHGPLAGRRDSNSQATPQVSEPGSVVIAGQNDPRIRAQGPIVPDIIEPPVYDREVGNSMPSIESDEGSNLRLLRVRPILELFAGRRNLIPRVCFPSLI